MTQVLTCLFLSMGLLGANETAVEKAAQAVIAAHKHDNPFLVQQRLSQSIVQFKPNQITRLDEQLQKAGLPTAANLLGQLRLKFVQQNFADALPVPKGRERLLLLKYLQEHVEEFTKKTRQRGREIKSGKLAETLDEFEDQLWDLHVLRNELLTAERIAAYAKSLANDKAGNALGLLTADDKAFIKAVAAGENYEPLVAADRELTELEMEMRLVRLEQALEVLRVPALTKQRFIAAYSTGLDARTVFEFLVNRKVIQEQLAKKGKSALPENAVLDQPGLMEKVKNQAEEAKQLAGNLADKSRWLFEGLHWWQRGRYGSGPEVRGLVKSEAAMRNPQDLVWLYMPRAVRPEPLDPAITGLNQVPQYSRRFLYTWAWQDLEFNRAEFSTDFEAAWGGKFDNFKAGDSQTQVILPLDQFY